jgi:hypothetical protein
VDADDPGARGGAVLLRRPAGGRVRPTRKPGTVTLETRWNCDCFHAPEEHGPEGCNIMGAMSGPCPCKKANP